MQGEPCRAAAAGSCGRDACRAFGGGELRRPDELPAAGHHDHPGSVVHGGQHGLGLDEGAGRSLPGGGDDQARAQSNIHFEVWIPTEANWNGKYQQTGNGGFAGSISLNNIANAVSRGYAAAATDDGTSGPPPAHRRSSATRMSCSTTAIARSMRPAKSPRRSSAC
jgi:hypothetical protein